MGSNIQVESEPPSPEARVYFAAQAWFRPVVAMFIQEPDTKIVSEATWWANSVAKRSPLDVVATQTLAQAAIEDMLLTLQHPLNTIIDGRAD